MYRLSSLILALWGFTQIYAQTSPHGKNLNIDCAKCHTSDGWDIDYKTLKFDHNVTDFKLEGAHRQTNCTDCHKTLVFDKTASDCMSCHTDIHSASVGNDCARCHSPKSWTIDNIPELHDRNGFSLTGAHDNLACIECHTSETNLRFDRIGNDCISCHKDDFNKTTDPNHVTNNFSLECTLCHSQFETAWTPVSVEHDFFPLTEGHDIKNCLDCHKNGQFDDTSSDCVSCHQTTFDNTTNPNHKNANFDTDCKSCHTTSPGWTPATFDHDFFALTQGHDIQDCNACHSVTTNYADTPTDCVGCHQTDFNNTTDPNHIDSGFPTDCVTCHTTSPGWTPTTFDHSFFPLTDGHDLPDCKQCHTTASFSDQVSDCVSCHQTNFDNTTGPNHTTAGFDNDCAKCHTPGGWTPTTFDHSFFPLTLGHDVQDCATCHTEPVYANQSPDCVSCHQTDFNNTTDPNHVAAGFPTDCTSCHTTNPGWTPATFDHSSFPLTDGHDIQDCTACHTAGNFNNISTDCVSCHQTNFDNTTNPNHTGAGFDTDCAKCHTPSGWTPSTFDHSFFPLTLGHDVQDCATCHTEPVYANQSPDCVSCHQTNFNNTTNPNHISSGFPTDCASCHTTNPGWTPSTFDHSSFPLTDGHNIQDCTACHTAGNFTNISPDCVSCHQTNFDNTTNPNHTGAGFDTDCAKCHTPSGWTPSSFDHSVFPLTLGHNIQDCNACHTEPVYANQSPNCVSCHQTNFDNTTNPNHVIGGFPTDCASCHTTNPGWSPATFDHTNFPLTLGHDIQDCNACHTTGNFSDASPDCVSCHQTDFNNTTNPNHSAAGFPTDCVSCHTTNPGWTPSTFDHDGQYFPIYTGKHQGEWNTCSECHTVANNFTSFSCIDCHEHNNQASLANEHNGVANYTYQSTACFDCHPTGGSGD